MLRDVNDPDSVIESIPMDRIEIGMEFAEGRMKKKILASKEALEGGVKRVVISSSNVSGPVQKALNGQGTVLS